MHPSHVSRRRFLGFSGAAGAAFLASGGLFTSRAKACPGIGLPDEGEMLANGMNRFAVDLDDRLARDEKGTMFFSPFSISTALAMTSAGARGETLAEMEKTLHLPQDSHPTFGDLIHRLNRTGPYATRCPRPYDLSVANAIWAQKDFPWRKEFVELTRKHYGAGVVETDFAKSEAARKAINDWVEEQTRKRIKDLIGPGVITALTRMVLANAVYFKSNWQTKFDKKDTKDAPFKLGDETTATVPLMTVTSEFNYGEFDMLTRRPQRVQVLELPYVENGLSMLVYLPEHADGLKRLGLWLTAEQLTKPELRQQKVVVHLPRFKAESKFSLERALMDLGMKKAFGLADFTGMSPEGKKLFISHVLHKAFVEVNEEGSEAAAATAVVIKTDSARPQEPEFRADRPFLFTIRENKTGAVLFMGRYTGPKA